MSDLISRSALLKEFSRNEVYKHITNSEGKNVLDVIKEQPTAFDLESAIKQLKELKTYKLDLADALCEAARSGRFGTYVCLEDVIEILKSDANATNGKNGG